MWFTDPPFGILSNYEGHVAPLELPTNVYRVDGRTGQATVVAGDVPRPNGSAFSPDEQQLYVVVSGAMPREIRVYDVVDDGTTLANGRVFIDCGAGIPDGFRVRHRRQSLVRLGRAAKGWTAWPSSTPTASSSAASCLPERCANLCFGGAKRNRLFMAASTVDLLRLRQRAGRDAQLTIGMASLSRQLARWVVGLRYEDLAAAVVDRAKGVTLQALASVAPRLALTGRASGGQARHRRGDRRAQRRDHPGQWHPGDERRRRVRQCRDGVRRRQVGHLPHAHPSGHEHHSGRPRGGGDRRAHRASDFITGLAAGYEVMERLAADFIPTVMARGFHAGPVFGIFGAAVAAAKICASPRIR